MEETDIYKKIKSLADDLARHQSCYSRADVAFELKSFGIQKDSIEVSKLIYEAYLYYKQDRNIATTMISNNGRITVIEEYEIQACLSNGNNEKAIDIATHNLRSTDESIQEVIDELKADIIIAIAKGGSVITGTNQINKIQSEASSIYQAYAKLVGYYTNAEESVKETIHDFVAIRTYIHDIFVEYSSALIDIYGDRIKVVAPNLFDYNSVEYLDVNALMKKTELAFNSLTEKCGVLMSEISDNFKQCYQMAIAGYKLADKSNKKLAVVMGGLELLSHYISTAEKATALTGELTKLKSSVTHDTTLIKSDMGRLMVIYKQLNDLYIPKANAFNRYSKEVLTEDLNSIFEILYNDPEAQNRHDERESILAECKTIEHEINDHLSCINIYKASIADLSTQLKSTERSYRKALGEKPSRPNVITNIFTFGNAGKKYNRAITNWNNSYGQVINNFEDAQTDLKIDKDELSNHEQLLSRCQKEYKSKFTELDKVNIELRKRVNASSELQLKMIQHLKPMIGLLNLAKEILESDLDKQLTTAVTINNCNQIGQLPPELSNNIQQFTTTLLTDMHISKEETNQYISSLHDQSELDIISENETVRKANMQLRKDINQAQNRTIDEGIELFNHWIELQRQETNHQIAKQQYKTEFEKIKKDFKRQLNAIDDKSTYLRKVLQQINTAQNTETLKEGLLLLGDLNEKQLSDKDFQDFLNDKRTIKL